MVKRNLEGVSEVYRAIIYSSFSKPYSNSKDFKSKSQTADDTRIITCRKLLFIPIFLSSNLCIRQSTLSLRESVRARAIY